MRTGIPVPAITKSFVVADRFQVNIGSNVKKSWKKGEVKISLTGGNFKSCFLSQTVAERDGYLMSSYQIKESVCDEDIRFKLGGGHETDLPGLLSLLGQQPEGEKGVLLTNGRANIFYIKDCTGAVRVVSVDWRVDGWCLYSRGLGDRRWYDGRRVFARNSGN
jgi:hypothetical protein